ncbi:MAG: preprotein translocase subunit SecY [Cytophagales bacterium]|nr:preprotein translocase subunit SecY [Cytophagales bacterium]
MKRLFITLRNIFSVEELRERILNTLFFIMIFRLGSYIVLPGVDPNRLSEKAEGIFGLLDTLLGGAFSNASILALGIMPYISASIVFQLLTVAVPYFQRIQREGESGRARITQYTRLLAVAVAFVQAVAYTTSTIPSEAIMVENTTLFTFSTAIILSSGTVFCMWLGERITEKGIGNGISMLIMIGIISRFPGGLTAEFLSRGMGQALFFLIEMVLLFFVVMFVVMLTQGVRRVPVQYVKQVMGSRTYGGQRQYLPLRVNSAGVMPIIFAQSLMFLPAMISGVWAEESDLAQYVGTTFSDITSWQYNLAYGLLIVIFTFFYTAVTVNPQQMAEDMKRNGSFIPGVRPGTETANYMDNILTRIMFPGALFLACVAVLPAFAIMLGVSQEFAQFYGGTSLLIMVGVVLDTLQQIESHLLVRRYDGLMESGRVAGRQPLPT